MNLDELKEKLSDIKADNYLPGNADIGELITEMMRNIGSADYVLRDELIYSTLNKWTVIGVISAAQMREMLSVCLDDEHLFYKIGEYGTDAVFTRTFSVLIVPLAFYIDSKERFLSEPEVNDIKERVIRYLELEKDVRGYVEGKGWAHSIAHAADALDDIAKSEYIGRSALLEILAAMKDKVCVDYYTYIHKEDERMAAAALSVFEREVLRREEIVRWINSFGDAYSIDTFTAGTHHENIRKFLRSLYLAAGDRGMKDIADAALNVLGNI